MARGLKAFVAEAKRRRVFRTAGVYVVAAWGISQGAAELAPLFGAPDWLVRGIVVGSVLLLPVVIVLAWMFEIGRGGIVRDPEDVLDRRLTESDLSDMPTIARGMIGAAVIIVRWTDKDGEHARLFQDGFFLGRGKDCRVRFYDPLVSRRHARIYFEDGGWRLEDLKSRNGTLVNQQPADGSVLVGESQVRLNEAGPVLRIEVAESGPVEDWTDSDLEIGFGVAHVRAIR
ncbi:MAG: FHA domain-containing protein [Myxococcota bacterium]